MRRIKGEQGVKREVMRSESMVMRSIANKIVGKSSRKPPGWFRYLYALTPSDVEIALSRLSSVQSEVRVSFAEANKWTSI
jgi:hypothetical protein